MASAAVVAVSLLVGVAASPAAPDAKPQPALALLVRVLAETDDAATQRDVLKGMQAALQGRRRVAMPEGWPAVARKLRQSPNGEVRETALEVALILGDPEVPPLLRKTAADPAAPEATRRFALKALVQYRDPELPPVLFRLLDDRDLRGAAVRGLAAYNAEQTPQRVLERYKSFTPAEKADAVNTLASRPAYARALVAALEDGRVPRADVDTFIVRQLHGLKDKELSERLNKAWGTIRPVSQEKAALTARYRKLLTPEYLKGADLSRGRALFARNCASCHTLFDAGGKVGPKLTGGQRANLEYVLENVLDPSAVVAKEYQVTVLTLKDGRVVNGIIRREDDRLLEVQTPNDLLRVAKDDIDERQRSPLSLMPEGILTNLKDDEVRDLVAYLASPKQVPLPKEGAP